MCRYLCQPASNGLTEHSCVVPVLPARFLEVISRLSEASRERRRFASGVRSSILDPERHALQRTLLYPVLVLLHEVTLAIRRSTKGVAVVCSRAFLSASYLGELSQELRVIAAPSGVDDTNFKTSNWMGGSADDRSAKAKEKADIEL